MRENPLDHWPRTVLMLEIAVVAVMVLLPLVIALAGMPYR